MDLKTVHDQCLGDNISFQLGDEGERLHNSGVKVVKWSCCEKVFILKAFEGLQVNKNEENNF